MAHELDFSEVTGQANMFTVRTMPWHEEGIILNEAPRYEDALKLAELDYDVTTLPIRVMCDEAGIAASIDSPIGRAIVRTDRIPQQRSILGIVGQGYTPLQNREAFEILEPLIDNGLLSLQTGGVLREGADAWLLGKLTIDDPFVNDVFQGKTIPYILVSNNHNGKQPVTVMYTPIEVVCANTLGMAHHGRNKSNSTVLKKHTKTVRERFVDEAIRFFQQTLKMYRIVAEDYKFMKERILSVEEFTKTVLDEIAPLPNPDAEQTSHSDSVLNRIEGKRDLLIQGWDSATGNTGNHSAYEAYMTVTELLDYSDSLIKIRKNGSRIQSMISGPIYDTKQRVLDNLVALSRQG